MNNGTEVIKDVPEPVQARVAAAAKAGLSQHHTPVTETLAAELRKIDAAYQAALKSKRDGSTGKTAALWAQFVDVVEIINRFEFAERTSDFDLHCKSLAQLLPYIAAAGRYNYYPTLSLYLSDMQNLAVTHPEVHKAYAEGNHAPRPTEQFWGGKETDLFCEEMMRVMKSSEGGFIHIKHGPCKIGDCDETNGGRRPTTLHCSAACYSVVHYSML